MSDRRAAPTGSSALLCAAKSDHDASRRPGISGPLSTARLLHFLAQRPGRIPVSVAMYALTRLRMAAHCSVVDGSRRKAE